ncbi:hypothetical protein V1511DRAFT_493519 [Dipodascopsis uninucleata]
MAFRNKGTGNRVLSGAFTQMNQSQINQIKEAFTMLDKDRDGVISRSDLEQMLTSLGQYPSSEELDEMLSGMPTPLQFPSFLTEMSSTLSKFSTKEELITAFGAFDDDDNGKEADAEDLREALIEMGGMTKEEINSCIKPFVRFGLGRERLLYKDLVDAMVTV